MYLHWFVTYVPGLYRVRYPRRRDRRPQPLTLTLTTTLSLTTTTTTPGFFGNH
jgi:hypothetical protein